MSANPLTTKIAVPYARALFDFSVNQCIMNQITDDFQNLEVFLKKNPELTQYLNNPLISSNVKREVLVKTLQSQINAETFKFLLLLVDKNRINILDSVIAGYLALVYEIVSIKVVYLSTAFPFTKFQEDALVQKLKKLINAKEIRLITTIDPNLIGGFSIQTESKVIDFTIKNQLQKLAQHLDTVLKI